MKITADDFLKNLKSRDTTLAMLVTLKEVKEQLYAVNVMIGDGIENTSLRAVIAGILESLASMDGGLDEVLAAIEYLQEEAQAEMDPAGVESWS